jgi:Zn-dependent protease
MSAATAALRSSFMRASVPNRYHPGSGVDHHVRVLSFRLFGIPIGVRPSFFLVAILLGLSTGSVAHTAAWVAIVFFSILIHELGHAFTARAFGSTVRIELNTMGGLTSWSVEEDELGPGRRALVAAAGSGVGVIFGGIVWLVANATAPHDGMTAFVISNLILVNLFWGLLNWLPIRPLDGGHLLVSLLEKVAPKRAEKIADVVFLITAIAAVAAAIWFRLIFVGILAGWLLLTELSLRTRSQRGTPAPPVPRGLPTMTFDDEPPAVSVSTDEEEDLEETKEPGPADG